MKKVKKVKNFKNRNAYDASPVQPNRLFYLAVFQCYPNYAPDIIRSSNLPNTFLDLFRHSYMSLNSHMKKIFGKNGAKSVLSFV